jgi:hypothetical protein
MSDDWETFEIENSTVKKVNIAGWQQDYLGETDYCTSTEKNDTASQLGGGKGFWIRRRNFGGSQPQPGSSPRSWNAFEGYQRFRQKTPSPGRSPLGPICLWACLINIQSAAVEFKTIQSGDCFHRFRMVAHLDKPKIPLLSSVTVRDDINPLHGSVFFKQRTEHIFRCRDTEVAYTDLLHTFGPSSTTSDNNLRL